MAYVDLEDMPSAKKEYIFSFPSLTGGLNVRELDYRLDSNESPKMQNLRWRDGVLSSRDGQIWKNSTLNGVGHTAYQYLWCDSLFAHIGTKIMCFTREGTKTDLYTGLSDFTVRGTFFAYDGKLYYKTKGYYICIESSLSEGTYTFTAYNVLRSGHEAYIPITYINCDPTNGSGDVYQPENRLSSKKTLWYNASHKVTVASSSQTLTPEIVQVTWLSKISSGGTYTFTYDGLSWSIGGDLTLLSNYGISVSGTPASGDTITVTSIPKTSYFLPVKDSNTTISKVLVDDTEISPETYVITTNDTNLTNIKVNAIKWSAKFNTSVTKTFTCSGDPDYEWSLDGTVIDMSDYGITYTGTPSSGSTITVAYTLGGYSFNPSTGELRFRTAPPVTVPATNNTVKITYRLENETAYNNIMDCRYVATYGGVSNSLCIVMAGSDTQPNAYFWNGQNSVSMDATYFPMTQYQIAGDFIDPITGFGKQQSYLIIFNENSVGRTSIETETIDDRSTIDLAYVPINDKIGCNLPWTIQLVENNLVWCNTEQGVHFLANTSSAYENNVVCISSKINGTSSRAALLHDLRSEDYDCICSIDTEHRYWLVANGHAWVWDYDDGLSTYKDPSWFYYTNINAIALVIEHDPTSLGIENLWHIDAEGRMTHFENTFSDYGEAINKVYRFATQYFSTYDNLKTVTGVLITMRSDTNSETTLRYISDYEDREDKTLIESSTFRLVPRDLSERNLFASRFASRFKRKPMCRRIAHFTMELSNNIARQDMSIVTAQIIYVYQGRQR